MRFFFCGGGGSVAFYMPQIWKNVGCTLLLHFIALFWLYVRMPLFSRTSPECCATLKFVV